MASKEDIDHFLNNLKEKIKVFEIVFRPRDKNLDALAELDILPVDRIDIIKNLSHTNYFAGPKKDGHDGSRPDYYEFGVVVNNIEVYIKISMGRENKEVDCMSFHKAERPITYPYN